MSQHDAGLNYNEVVCDRCGEWAAEVASDASRNGVAVATCRYAHEWRTSPEWLGRRLPSTPPSEAEETMMDELRSDQ